MLSRAFFYYFHEGSDQNGFVISVMVTAANVHDSQIFSDVFEQVVEHVGKPEAAKRGIDTFGRITWTKQSICDTEVNKRLYA
ncbi:hypothetical protein P4S93_02480 [Aneurinibacillus thermoaerophilus]|uniref:Transposase DDE domain-containing protein n=1 Tax=Aneurinibacillus thermoaerophilus TaxID=143495 RepID=A0ABX8Y8N7_ANETH|nr:hypothetical protein [Aneurinibacillus thermoaerophilus]AMA72188.1 hypothetical protein ACH33_04510 [Aneurinibacillus sp. XH2]MED0736523.1 hypothetical protein [Aneurinibacillus thermoaerophilus]MED0756026.1 hypothetical protein [Aneurinibacillus thermoaerophilus]MED0759650.1 hypothetical protein [Aneurinibacillus thermoaerophilus]QYY42046.1 hypothetical protein K3F53_14395 [Aneurinibacillus thermoaerophilus]